jgi:hypothetical protein
LGYWRRRKKLRRYERVQVLEDLENGDIVLEFTLGPADSKNWLLVMNKAAAEEMARRILAPVATGA